MKEQKKVIRFLGISLGLFISWFIVYDIWLSRFDDWICLRLAESSAGVLGLLGYNAAATQAIVSIDGAQLVLIGWPCNGMVMMALFTGFILAFPGPALKKLFYIPLGIILINLINVLRVTALALNSYYSYESLEFNHKYTFTIVVYAFIFGLWMLWVKRFSTLNSYAVTISTKEQQPA